MSWISDFFAHGGAKLLFFVVIILFHLAKVASKKGSTTAKNQNPQSNSAPSFPSNSRVATPGASSQSAFSPGTNLNQSTIAASPWASNQNPFDFSTQKTL